LARILIADDDPDYLDAFIGGMTALGHEVEGVLTGVEAVGRVGESSFDVVFLDVVMKGGGAISLLHEIRKTHPDLPIIVISGRTELIDSPVFREGMGFSQARIRKTASLSQMNSLVQSILG